MRHLHKLLSVGWALALLLIVPSGIADSGKTRIGKNPGQTKGRWLEINDVDQLKTYSRVALGDVSSTIQWRNPGKETPIDEDLLNDKIREHLMMNLKASGLFSEVMEDRSDDPQDGTLRLDCELMVDPGNRATRYLVGFGAGKSKSILTIHLRDDQTDEELGLYHGYGTGSGMGFKLAGGGARKMTQDDIQENAKEFAELLQKIL